MLLEDEPIHVKKEDNQIKLQKEHVFDYKRRKWSSPWDVGHLKVNVWPAQRAFCALLHNDITKRPHQTGWPKQRGGFLPTCGPIKQLFCMLTSMISAHRIYHHLAAEEPHRNHAKLLLETRVNISSGFCHWDGTDIHYQSIITVLLYWQ